MRSNKFKFLLIILFLTELVSVFLTYKSFLNREIAEIKENYEVDKRNFAMFINDGNDNYVEYTSSNLFPEGYEINVEKSKCVDTKGNVIDGILSGSGTNITVKSTTTSYCYLYFDIKVLTAAETLIENVSGDTLWASTLEDDGYRFVGTAPANYICFGYSDASTDCDFTNAINTDLYAYRIIGIFKDSAGEQHLKLIKKEALNTAYMWSENYEADIAWDASDLYNGINGSYFLSNTTYSYMQDTNWTNKIVNWDYTATNTLTDVSSGPNYVDETVVNVYLHEMNQSSKTSSVGIWDTINAKIGLMYVSDYLLSLGSSVLGYTSYTNSSTLATGWMHLTNNDSGAPSSDEWTMSRCGDIQYLYYNAVVVTSSGSVDRNRVDITTSVRPVFYLTNDVTISGEGTLTSPYIIS